MRIPLTAALTGAALIVAISAQHGWAQQSGQAAPGAAAVSALPSQAAPSPPLPYGMPIAVSEAKKIAAAAIAEARKNGFPSTIAIVDPSGALVYLEKMDGANNSTVDLAIKKAQTAATFRRPSKMFEERLTSGQIYVLGLGVTPVGGGIPIAMQGHIVGAIGASGAPSSDGDIAAAQAGVGAL